MCTDNPAKRKCTGNGGSSCSANTMTHLFVHHNQAQLHVQRELAVICLQWRCLLTALPPDIQVSLGPSFR